MPMGPGTYGSKRGRPPMKKKRDGMMYGSKAMTNDRQQANMGRRMYMEGSKVHSGGSQPVYGSTVADAMPVAGKN